MSWSSFVCLGCILYRGYSAEPYTLQRGAPYTLLLSLVTLTVLRFGHSTLSPSCTEEHARLSVSRRTNQKTLTN